MENHDRQKVSWYHDKDAKGAYSTCTLCENKYDAYRRFGWGKAPEYYADVNSEYPAVMLSQMVENGVEHV